MPSATWPSRLPESPNGIVVGIMGLSLGTGNRGVAALQSSLVGLVASAAPLSRIVMFVSDRDPKPLRLRLTGRSIDIPVANFRFSLFARPSEHWLCILPLAILFRVVPIGRIRLAIRRCCPWIDLAARAALVGDIRGGDSFSDLYGLWRFCLSSMPVLTAFLLCDNIVLLPQTYGPYKHWISRVIARFILRRASWILAREHEGIRTVQRLTGSAANVRFCPDVAFGLESREPTSPGIWPPLALDRTNVLVGLNINGMLYHRSSLAGGGFGLKFNYRDFMAKLTAALLDHPPVRLLLIPHAFGQIDASQDDLAACTDLLKSAPVQGADHVHIVNREHDAHELKGIIGWCDFFVGARLHACIAALSQGTPTVGIAYSGKFKGVFDSIGVSDWIVDARESNESLAIDTIKKKFADRTQMRAALRGRPAAAQQALRETFETLLHSLASCPDSPGGPDN